MDGKWWQKVWTLLVRIGRFLRGRVRYRVTTGGLLFLLALIITGSGAFLSGNNLLFLVFSAMLALVLVSGFLGRLVLLGLKLELFLPRHVAARAPTDAQIRILNLKRFTPSFSIELSSRAAPLTGEPPILSSPIYFPVIEGGGSVEVPVQVTFPYRGRHRENLFVLSTRFPFGFLRREVSIPVSRETIVYPAIEAGPGTELLLAGLEGEAATQERGRGQDFYRIRPWEASDGVRMVDWKSTAHTGVLQAREFAREDHRTVEIILDRTIPRGAEARFEALVEECAYLIWTLSDRVTPFALVCDGQAQTEVYAALRYLAMVQPVVAKKGAEQPMEPAESTARITLSAWE